MASKSRFTLPGLSQEKASKVVKILQERLNSYNDLQLTLKHVHWNVVGPSFIGVHEMIDPQVDHRGAGLLGDVHRLGQLREARVPVLQRALAGEGVSHRGVLLRGRRGRCW